MKDKSQKLESKLLKYSLSAAALFGAVSEVNAQIVYSGVIDNYLSPGETYNIDFNRDGAEFALEAVGLLYHFPAAHINLGIALAKMAMYERAIEAFRVTLTMTPESIRVHRYLSYIYKYKLKKHEKADEHIIIMKQWREKRQTIRSFF